MEFRGCLNTRLVQYLGRGDLIRYSVCYLGVRYSDPSEASFFSQEHKVGAKGILKKYHYKIKCIFFSDDGRTKPTPNPAKMLKTGKSAGKGKAQQAPPPPKPRSDSTNADHPDYSCLIRATFNGQKISSVVSEFRLTVTLTNGQL